MGTFMDLGHILPLGAVKSSLGVSSKKRLFHVLGDMMQATYRMDPRATVAALCEREQLGPTGVGHGVALPHARLEGLDAVSACFVRLDEPIEFGAVDRRPVDLVLAIFAPPSSGVEHLKALAAASRVLRDKNARAQLRANADPQTLHAILSASGLDAAA